MEFVPNQSGKKYLFMNGFSYRKQKTRGEKIYWVCSKDKSLQCMARCNTVNGAVTVTNPSHTHTVNPSERQVRTLLAEIKEKAKSTRDPPCQIIASSVKNVSRSVSANLPSDELLTKKIKYERKVRSVQPVNPTSLDELLLPLQYTLTFSNEPFLLFDSGTSSGEERIMIFSTQRNLEKLSATKYWHGDGTFKCVPLLFTQLFTIQGVEEDTILPYVYSLLPNKSETTYIRFLNALKIKAGERGLDFKPESITVDFELAFHNAMKKEFDGIQINGCFFHFSQSLWRKIQKYPEILKHYTEDDEFALNLRLLAALAFLPVAEVVEAFDMLLDTDFFATREEMLRPFINYFEDVWIGRSQRNNRRRAPQYAHSTWNVFLATVNGASRTNNKMEGWHRRFSVMMGAYHPTIWKFISTVQNEQSRTENKLNQIEAGHPTEKQRKKYKDLDKRILNIVQKHGSITTIQYLTGIAQNLSYNV